MTADPIKVDRVSTNSKIFAFTRWDILPTLGGLFHLAFFFALFFLYPRTPLWIMVALGFLCDVGSFVGGGRARRGD